MIHNSGWTNRQLLGCLVFLAIVPILIFLHLDPQSPRETLIFVIALGVSYVLGCSLLVASNLAVERRLKTNLSRTLSGDRATLSPRAAGGQNAAGLGDGSQADALEGGPGELD